MPNNYTFFDSDGSILTARSSIVSGSAHDPYVQISSFLTSVPTTASGNQSVSGTVGSSIIGQLPAGTAVLGSVAALQGTNPWITRSSVSGTVDASLIGMLPAGTQVLGSVAVLQGTNPWRTLGSVSGTVVIGTIPGSVLSQQLGARTTSIVGSIPSSTLVGSYGHRNDATAAFLGGNLTWNPVATDSAGRIIIKPFTSDDGTLIEYQGSVVSTSVTLIRASAIGLRNYVTDFFMANTGATTTLVTFQDGSTSILGRTIAPTASGSNAPHLAVPMKSARSQDLAFAAGSNTSVLYVTVRGYQAP